MYRLATLGVDEPAGAMYYYDQPADMILYKGLANRALGDEKGACRCFNKLMDYGERHLYDKVKNDLPRKQVEPMMQTKRRRKWKCHGKWQFHFFVRLAAHVANG